MKKCVVLVLAVMAMTSCQKVDLESYLNNDEEEQTEAKECRDVQFVMKNLSVSYGDKSNGESDITDETTTQMANGPRKATLASESITDLWVWEGSTLLKHQTSTDSDFGNPTISLTVGAHDLTFVASKATGQSWAEGVWSCTKMKDTFGTVLAYTVSKSSTSKQVELDRRVGKVMWTIEDEIPSGATTMTMALDKQCLGLDKDLNGVNGQSYESEVSIGSYAGKAGVTASVFVMPESTEGNAVVAKISIDDLCNYENEVTVKANEICNIHGSFFGGEQTQAVSVNEEWGETTDYAIQ